MIIHNTAGLPPLGRERLARSMLSGYMPASAAARAGLCPKTARKWPARYRARGLAGVHDRSSWPRKLPEPTAPQTVERIIARRRRRYTAKHIACQTGGSPATVSRRLKPAGLSRLKDLDPAKPLRRYQHPRPGDMIHLDIKTLGRFNPIAHRITKDRRRHSHRRGNGPAPGWDYGHVAIDHHSRLSFSQIMTDQEADSARAHLKAALASDHSLGVTVARVMTDNGSYYPSADFATACKDLKINHLRTKPHTPKPNGKAERFIQTAWREQARARAYRTLDQRAADLPLVDTSLHLA